MAIQVHVGMSSAHEPKVEPAETAPVGKPADVPTAAPDATPEAADTSKDKSQPSKATPSSSK